MEVNSKVMTNVDYFMLIIFFAFEKDTLKIIKPMDEEDWFIKMERFMMDNG